MTHSKPHHVLAWKPDSCTHAFGEPKRFVGFKDDDRKQPMFIYKDCGLIVVKRESK